MPSADVSACVGADEDGWARFAAHWDDLAIDRYAAASGTNRQRRYGTFTLSGADELVPQPHEAFVQPEGTHPVYRDVGRHLEPLTGAFIVDPVLRALVGLLGAMARSLDDQPEWTVLVHPFRVIATAHQDGRPTPEGRHRDGVTLVSSLLIGRENVIGGQSAVYEASGAPLLRTTLGKPGTLLLADDRRTLHEVSPIRPLDPARAARRDVLVTTLRPR